MKTSFLVNSGEDRICRPLDYEMTLAITLSSDHINNLDLSPVQKEIEKLLQTGVIASYEQQLKFDIDYPREPEDPRELSEIPEIRLWFIRLDAYYPWLPFLLDLRSGEFIRYTAMLVPHQFNRTEGIQYNPEALEIFVMGKVFILTDWLSKQGIASKSRLQSMAQMLGYELDDALFTMISD
ncbi:MAG: CRR6 family NdhI maturation factor [Coleofasciculaceae cyanobacterium]